LYHRTQINGTWSLWEDLGGDVISIPSAVTWGVGHLAVFVFSSDLHIRQITYSGEKWGAWQDIGGPWGSPAGALTFGPNTFELFVNQSDLTLHQLSYRNGVWSQHALGGNVSAAPFALATSPHQGYGIVRGTDSQFYYVSATEPISAKLPIHPYGWTPIGPLGRIGVGQVAAGVSSKRGIDLFGISDAQTLLHAKFDGSHCSAWEDLGPLAIRPVAISLNDNEIDLYFINGFGFIITKKWTSAGGWGPISQIGV